MKLSDLLPLSFGCYVVITICQYVFLSNEVIPHHNKRRTAMLQHFKQSRKYHHDQSNRTASVPKVVMLHENVALLNSAEHRSNATPPGSENDEDKGDSLNKLLSPNTPGEMNFGACLLVMDDNHFLIEWLAYHYLVLPLTHLIIAVDPASKTSPLHVLERWKGMIDIQVWNDTTIDFKVPQHRIDEPKCLINWHRYRQVNFYQKCMKSHQAEGVVEWVMITDTDEFVRPNKNSEIERGAILRNLQNQSEHDNGTECIHMPRFSFAGKMKWSRERPKLPKDVKIPQHKLLTMRYQYRSHNETAKTTVALGKNLVNVKAVKDFPRKAPISVHQVLPQCSVESDQDAPTVHHYQGSEAQFYYRNDPRSENEDVKLNGFRTPYKQRFSDASQKYDPIITPWLPKFVELVGGEKAVQLLAGVGNLEKGTLPSTVHPCHILKKNTSNTGGGKELNSSINQPYYLKGKTSYHDDPFDDFLTWDEIENGDIHQFSNSISNSSWVLPNKMLHSTRNHDSLILESKGRKLLFNILGRGSRHVQVMDLITGEQWAHTSSGMDPDGFPLNDLNHVYTVLVDDVKNENKKELWLPCGFRGDRIKFEQSVHYSRIVDLETLQVRVGPKLPYSGGACVAQALEIIPNEPPMICTFGGTIDSHDSGKFLPYSTCYDRVRGKWWFPFGKMPMGFDHGSIAYIPPDACNEGDPARLIILNFRIESFGSQRGEMLAYDLPVEGWSIESLEDLKIEDTGDWYMYTNITYTGPEDVVNCPRDASGTVTVNNGKHILNYGGIFYSFPNGKIRDNRFSVVRSFNVCEKQWDIIGDLGVQTYALQTCASQELQISITCGGESRYPDHEGMNNPWCMVNNLEKNFTFQNRHGLTAVGGYVDNWNKSQIGLT
mmetsp:Transcript_30876/g.46878  ORF Transcript_30876/g.46878 Transcript_30876/m.46878 type:complete len:886 (-) Transcript_30876:79-2736(-)|eukprot:CAMPEP_0178902516 /NCGR_PEP_ID=MMETSP0786-20121207/4648_1 /TAXON_ID=186022 /ORGANISM="Thalassionema frauenfeldii, Strain CCMP 1798" /LENGTH=885 /DNA_ID=CAMNT_0020573791 /DNA_START=1 /DNA_END=2658 /DNA_ORIENTATION=+